MFLPLKRGGGKEGNGARGERMEGERQGEGKGRGQRDLTPRS